MNPILKLIGEAEDFSEYADILALDAEQEKTLFNRNPVPVTPKEAYTAALKFDKGRVPERLERIISKDAGYSYEYARVVLSDRFPLGEPAVSSDAWWSFLYAKYVVKPGDFVPGSKRFPPGEPAIAKNAKESFSYALHTGARFPLGEPSIMRDRKLWQRYNRYFKIP